MTATKISPYKQLCVVHQTRYWVTAHDATALISDTLELRYLDSDIGVQPVMVQQPTRPPTLPEPCTCMKCARQNCTCRVEKIKRVKYCTCCGSENCQNPFNDHSQLDSD